MAGTGDRDKGRGAADGSSCVSLFNVQLVRRERLGLARDSRNGGVERPGRGDEGVGARQALQHRGYRA